MDVHRSQQTKRAPTSEGRLPAEADSTSPPRSEREGSVARLERAIRLTEERYRAIFDQAVEGIFLVAADYSIIDANESACRMLGYSHDELLAPARRPGAPPRRPRQPSRSGSRPSPRAASS